MTDNWEDLLDAPVIEIKKTEDIVKARYNDEDIEDPSVEKKNNRVNEEDKNESPPKESKKKADKKNVNEKTPVTIDPFGVPDKKAANPKANYDDRKKAELISKENDEKNIEDLFGDLKFENKNIEELMLKDESAHVQFAKAIGKILNRSNVKLHVVEFYKELLTSLYSKFTSKEYQDINTKVTVLFNQKQKEEKPLNTKKKVTKPTLKATKADQNSQIVDDEFEDEEEGGGYVPKFNHDDDFM